MCVVRLCRHVVPELGVEFVDRDVEACRVLGFRSGRVCVLLGPRGCGKTEFFKELMYSFENSEDYLFIVLSFRGRETEFLSNNVNFVKLIVKELSSVVREFIKTLGVIIDGIVSLVEILSKIIKLREVLCKNVFVVLDEFREVYPSDVSRQFLETEANTTRDVARIFEEHGGKYRLIVVTSDATATVLRNVVGTKVDWYLMWNLDKEATLTLLEKLRCSLDPELVWELTSGNPREIAILKNNEWNVEKWLQEKVHTIARTLLDYAREHNKTISQVIQELSAILENVDNIITLKAYDHLLKNNIIIDIDARFDKISKIENPTKLPSGKYITFQIAAYYHILKTMIEKNTIDIEPQDVLANLAR